MLTPGSRAPHFSLPTSDGSLFKSADYVGKKVLVVFFYPRDHTLGCTVESCAFRDVYHEFITAGADVVGISADPVTSHRDFQEKYALPFRLASDINRQTAQAFGVAGGPLGLLGRATFVIDKAGIVRDAYSSRFRVKRHVRRALDLVRSLARGAE